MGFFYSLKSGSCFLPLRWRPLKHAFIIDTPFFTIENVIHCAAAFGVIAGNSAAAFLPVQLKPLETEVTFETTKAATPSSETSLFCRIWQFQFKVFVYRLCFLFVEKLIPHFFFCSFAYSYTAWFRFT